MPRKGTANNRPIRCFGGPHDGYVVEDTKAKTLTLFHRYEQEIGVRVEEDHTYIRGVDPLGNTAYVWEGIK